MTVILLVVEVIGWLLCIPRAMGIIGHTYHTHGKKCYADYRNAERYNPATRVNERVPHILNCQVNTFSFLRSLWGILAAVAWPMVLVIGGIVFVCEKIAKWNDDNDLGVWFPMDGESKADMKKRRAVSKQRRIDELRARKSELL